MRGHRVDVHQDNEGLYYGKCQCPWSSGFPHLKHKWEVEDLAHQHYRVVDRARASLRRGGTLASEMRHAEEKIADPATSAKDRAVWQILWDGYHSRIGDKVEQDTLW